MQHHDGRRFLALIALVCLIPIPLNSSASAGRIEGISQSGIQEQVSNLPFAMPDVPLPAFPKRTVSIVEFGAIGNGHVMNTKAFSKAMQAVEKGGGGRVLVPAGIWLTGPIQLKSNIDLHLEKGAMILFSTRFEDYPLIETNFEGTRSVRCMSPIFGLKLENVAITGEGIIDGSGEAWRPVKKFKMTDSQWNRLITGGGTVNKEGNTWWPSNAAMNGAEFVQRLENSGKLVALEEYAGAREYLRPVMVSLVECRKILLDGPTFQNSPAWNIHPLLCEDLIIRNITVLNPWYSQNGDGLDLDSCRRAVVYNCRFDVGDDAICIKSGKDEAGRKRGRPCEYLAISDCVVYHGHGGVTIGSEMSGGVRNVSVRRCTFLGTDVGLRFKTTRGRGGIVEKIYISDILMKDIPTDAIGFNMYYGGDAPIPEPDGKGVAQDRSALPVTDGTPRFQDIILKNIVCRGAERGVLFEGLPEMPIQRITLDNALISARRGLECVDADQIQLKSIRIQPKTGPVIMLKDSRNVTIQNAECPVGSEVFMKLEGSKTGGIRLKDTDLKPAKKDIELGKGTPADAISRQ